MNVSMQRAERFREKSRYHRSAVSVCLNALRGLELSAERKTQDLCVALTLTSGASGFILASSLKLKRGKAQLLESERTRWRGLGA